MTKTKIICTLGPATEKPETLRELIHHGTDIFRLNMSHADAASVRKIVPLIRKTADELGRNVGVQGFYLGRLLRHEPEVVGDAVAELLALWQTGALKPIVGAEIPLAEVDRAHELVESRKSVGKVVLVP